METDREPGAKSPDSALTVARLTHFLSRQSQTAIKEIEVYQSIDSTNSEALRQLQSGSQGCRLIVAEAQSQGKGRRGRTWVSVPGGGIYLSLIWPVNNDLSGLQGLSLVTALSLYKTVKDLGGSALGLKWPNDVYCDRKKLAGILLQLRSNTANAVHVVIGVGINIVLPQQLREAIDQPVTDLTSSLGRAVDRNQVLALYLNELISNLDRFAEAGFAPFRDSWNQSDLYLNQAVVVAQGQQTIVGISQGVNDSGELLLKTEQDEITINGGEVFPSLRPIVTDESQ